MAFTFEYEISGDGRRQLDDIIKKTERLGTVTKTASKEIKEELGGAWAKGALENLKKLVHLQGQWSSENQTAIGTAKKLVDSLKEYDRTLVRLTDKVDRARAADKHQIEINRLKIAETLRYTKELEKARIQQALYRKTQEKALVTARAELDLKKQIAAAEVTLNPASNLQKLTAQNAILNERVRIHKELLSVKAKQEALGIKKTKAEYLEVEKLTAALKSEEAMRRKLLSVQLRMKNIKQEVQLMKEEAALKRLTTAERVHLDQQQRLLTAQVKNSAQYLQNEKAIAHLESRYRRATQSISHFNAVQSKGGILVSTFRNIMDAAGRHIAVYTAGMVGLAAAVYGTTRAIRGGFTVFNQYSEAMARVTAVSGATADQMKAVEAEARRLGRTTRFTATEAAEGLVQLTMAGLSSKEAVAALAPTLQLTSIGAMEFGEAADIVTNILRGFALQAADLPHVIDVMATSVTSSNMTVQQMGNSMSYVAPVAESFGVSIEAVAASMEVLHNSGIKASRAGTGMRRILLSLYTPTVKATKALEKAGVSTTTFTGKARPLIAVLQDLNKAFSQGKVSIGDFREVVGVRASNSFLQLIKAADGSVTSLSALEERLHAVAGAADTMQSKIEDFIGADWQKLISAVSDLGIGMLKLVDTDLRSWITGVTQGISELTSNPEALNSIMEALKQIGEAIIFVGKVFLVYKLGQTIYLLGINAKETAIYLATMGTRLLETAGLVKGWSAAVASGQGQVAASAISSAGIVDASGKVMQASNARTAASAMTMGKAFRLAATGIVGAVKWAGKAVLGFGLIGAAIWAASEAIGWLIGSFTDMGGSVDALSSGFDTLSGSIREAEFATKRYQKIARDGLGGLATREQINGVVSALKARDQAQKSLKASTEEYTAALKKKIELENKIVELSESGSAADESRIAALESQLLGVESQLEKTSKGIDSFSTEKIAAETKRLDISLQSVSAELARTEEMLKGLQTALETNPNNEGLLLSFRTLKEEINRLKGAYADLLEQKGKLIQDSAPVETGAVGAGPNLLEEAKRVEELVNQSLSNTGSEIAQTEAKLNTMLEGLTAILNGDLPEGISTVAGAMEFLKTVQDNLIPTYEKLRRLQEEHIALVSKTKEAVEQFNAARGVGMSLTERVTSLQEIQSEAMAEYLKYQDLMNKGQKLTDAQMKAMLKLIAKYNKAKAAEVKLLTEEDKARKKQNKEILASIALGEEHTGQLEFTNEELRKVANTFESSITAMGEYRVAQAKIIELLKVFPEYADDAAAALAKLRREASKVGKSEFEKTLIDWTDLTGDLDKASARWLSDFADTLGDFIIDGKADFSGFVDSILRDLAKLAARQFVVSIVGSFGGMTGRGPLLGAGGAGGAGGIGIGDAASVGSNLIGGGSMVAGIGSWLAGSSLAAGSPFLTGVAGGLVNAGTLGIGGAASTISGGLAAGGAGGLGAALGAAIPYIGIALAIASALGLFDDKEAASKFKVIPGGKIRNDPGFTTVSTDFGSELYKGSTSDRTNRSVINVDSVFGRMGAGVQHTGKDEQVSDAEAQQWLDSMVLLFSKLADIDSAIVDAYDLSDEAILRIKTATEDMDKMTKEWEAPDLGKYLVERYKFVFEEVGGIAEKVFNDLTQSGLSAENAVRAINAALSFDQALSGLQTVGQDADQILSDIGRTQTEVLTSQLEGIYELAEAYDGSIGSTEALTAALENQRRGTINLLLEIDKIRKSMTSGFSNLRESITTSLMNDEQKFNFYKAQLDYWEGVLANATDADKINEAQSKIVDLAGKQWQFQMGAGPEAAGQAQQQWLDYLNKQEEIANAQLDKAAEAAKAQAQELHDKIYDAINSAVIPIQEAADTTQEAADDFSKAAEIILGAGADMQGAGIDMKYAAQQMSNTNFTFTVEGSDTAVGFG